MGAFTQAKITNLPKLNEKKALIHISIKYRVSSGTLGQKIGK